MSKTYINKKKCVRHRFGHTLIELMVSMGTATFIVGGISSSLYIASRGLEQGGTAQRVEAGQILDKFVADAEHAISFSERTANAVTFTVPDRDGNGLPDTIRYAWSGTPGDPLTYEYNGSVTNIAEDVQIFNLVALTRSMTAPPLVFPPPIEGGSKLLFVVADPTSLNTKEFGRKDLMEGWGYTVTLIDDGDSQANFDTAAADNDVVYVSGTIGGGSLADKLTGSTTAIVSEFPGKLDNFGFCSSTSQTVNASDFSSSDAAHYISSPFSGGAITTFTSSLSMAVPSGTLAPGLQNVAEDSGTPALVALDAGGERYDSSPAPARRVHLPFAAAETSQLTADGQTLMQRAIEWGAGAGGLGGGPLLLVVSDDANPSTQEIARQTLMESWGYTVTLLDDDATTLELANAMVGNDVVYVSQEITTLTVIGKLKDAAIGVVNEEPQLNVELGFSSGAGIYNDSAMTVTNNTHYITSVFSTGSLSLFDPAYDSYTGAMMTMAPGAEILANCNIITALMTIDTGGDLYGGGKAMGRRVLVPWGDDFAALNTDGQTLMQRAIEWAATVEVPPPALLLVVSSAGAPTPEEDNTKTLIESWGYDVTLISDSDSQANFDAAVAANDVAYICVQVDDGLLDTKLVNATIGVVNEEGKLAAEFGLADAATNSLGTDVQVSDNVHYITAEFSLGALTIFNSTEDVIVQNSPFAPDLAVLAEDGSNGLCLVTISQGDSLLGGGTAAGRRVQLPWGNSSFDTASLTTDGQTLMRRAIEWAAGTGGGGGGGGGDPPPDGNFGYETQFASSTSPSNGVQVGTQVTLPQDGTLNSITAYINPGGGGKNYRFAIYSDNAGEPGNLLVESAVDNQSGTGWKTISVTPTPLTAGTYWLALAFSHGSQTYYYESTGGNTRHKLHDAVNNGYISVWPGSTTPYTRKVSIYGTYTPTP